MYSNDFNSMIKGLKFKIAGVVRQSSTKNTGLMTISEELVYMACLWFPRAVSFVQMEFKRCDQFQISKFPDTPSFFIIPGMVW